MIAGSKMGQTVAYLSNSKVTILTCTNNESNRKKNCMTKTENESGAAEVVQ